MRRDDTTVIPFMTRSILTFAVLSTELLAGPPVERPKFEDFPVKTIYRGTPSPPNLVTEDQRMFRTRISEGAKAKVEFAGHYTVPVWGCGSGCNDYVIADSITGAVYDGLYVVDLPSAWLEEHGEKKRMEYHPDSRLLKINGCPGEHDCGLYDYEMVDGKGLRLVRKVLLVQKYQPN